MEKRRLRDGTKTADIIDLQYNPLGRNENVDNSFSATFDPS